MDLGSPRTSGRAQRAQALVEYALILVLIAIVVIGVLVALGGGIQNTFQTIVNHLAQRVTPLAAPSAGGARTPTSPRP